MPKLDKALRRDAARNRKYYGFRGDNRKSVFLHAELEEKRIRAAVRRLKGDDTPA